MEYSLTKIYSDYGNVHEVCREVLLVSDRVGIQSVLIGGSLLGIIRDGDFLPWDKDLDFAVFEDEIDKTLALEAEYRALGYECRVHHLGVRSSDSLRAGMQALKTICQSLTNVGISYQLINGILLNLYRDGAIFDETDGISLLIEPDSGKAEDLEKVLAKLGRVYKGHVNKGVSNLTVVIGDWRFFILNYESDDKGYGWTDLNCEHRFSEPLFPASRLTIADYEFHVPNEPEAFLSARFGKSWHQPPKKRFSEGRVAGSMQLHKSGVMFDFIFHYVRGDKTYWYEPAANVISTIGFLPASRRETTAGLMLIPDNAEVFLEEHYGNWRVPVKSWDGAVDNPTIIDGKEAMSKILANDGLFDGK